MERQTARDTDQAQRLAPLRDKLKDAEDRLGRLYQAIENGIADPADTTLKERIAAVKSERDIEKAALNRALSELHPGARITDEKIGCLQ